MSARIVIRHQGQIYSFLRVQQDNDGSVYLTVPRENWEYGGVSWDTGTQRFLPAPPPDADREENLPRKVSYHTSGRVNYGDYLASCGPLFYEPLCDVTHRNGFFVWSVPRITRLDQCELPVEREGVASGVVELEPDGRHTFYAIIAPLGDDGADLGEWRVRLGYPTFALFVVLAALPVAVPDNMSDHFIFAAPSQGAFPNQRVGRLEAELAYHQRQHGPELVIYGPDGEGVYTLYPSVVMRIVPRLRLEFAEPRLEAEVVGRSRPNKVRFRIRGPGGYITNRDLRPMIRNIELDARL